jgi:hypothetical protein
VQILRHKALDAGCHQAFGEAGRVGDGQQWRERDAGRQARVLNLCDGEEATRIDPPQPTNLDDAPWWLKEALERWQRSQGAPEG